MAKQHTQYRDGATPRRKPLTNPVRPHRTERGPRRQYISFPVIQDVHGRLAAALLDGGDVAAAARSAEQALRHELDRVRQGRPLGRYRQRDGSQVSPTEPPQDGPDAHPTGAAS